MRPRTEKDIRRLHHQFSVRLFRHRAVMPSAYALAEILADAGLIEFVTRDGHGVPLTYRETDLCWSLPDLDSVIVQLVTREMELG